MSLMETWMILSVIVTVLGAVGCIAVVLDRVFSRSHHRRPMATYVDDQWRNR